MKNDDDWERDEQGFEIEPQAVGAAKVEPASKSLLATVTGKVAGLFKKSHTHPIDEAQSLHDQLKQAFADHQVAVRNYEQAGNKPRAVVLELREKMKATGKKCFDLQQLPTPPIMDGNALVEAVQQRKSFPARRQLMLQELVAKNPKVAALVNSQS